MNFRVFYFRRLKTFRFYMNIRTWTHLAFGTQTATRGFFRTVSWILYKMLLNNSVEL